MADIKTNPASISLGTAPISGLMLKYAIPSITAFLVSSLYNIADQIFIGQGVGYLGNAATTVASPLTTISTATALLLGIGTAAHFNMQLGKRQLKQARQTVGTGLACLALSSIILGAVTLLFYHPLLLAFGARPNVLPCTTTYVRITAFGLPLIPFSTGSSMTAMLFANSWASTLLRNKFPMLASRL